MIRTLQRLAAMQPERIWEAKTRLEREFERGVDGRQGL